MGGFRRCWCGIGFAFSGGLGLVVRFCVVFRISIVGLVLVGVCGLLFSGSLVICALLLWFVSVLRFWLFWVWVILLRVSCDCLLWAWPAGVVVDLCSLFDISLAFLLLGVLLCCVGVGLLVCWYLCDSEVRF